MKKATLTFCIAFLLSGMHYSLKAQESPKDYCLEPVYHENCYVAAKSIFEDLLYLKSRPFSQKMSNQKFILNLKKNTLYLFNICQGVQSNAVLTIYDGKTEKPIISTKNPNSGTLSRVLNFYTQASGQYLISVDMSQSDEPCVVIMMGLIRKNIDTYIKIPEEK